MFFFRSLYSLLNAAPQQAHLLPSHFTQTVQAFSPPCFLLHQIFPSGVCPLTPVRDPTQT